MGPGMMAPAGPSNDSAMLKSLQSPSSFVAGGVSFAASSHDIMMHLSACELSRGSLPEGGGGRLAALAGHLIGQRR